MSMNTYDATGLLTDIYVNIRIVPLVLCSTESVSALRHQLEAYCSVHLPLDLIMCIRS